MALESQLRLILGAETKRLSADLKKANGMMSKFSGQMKAIGGVIAGAFAVSAVKDFAKESMRLYDIQAKAEKSLLTALNGRVDVQERLKKQASDLQGVTLFGDEETIQAQSFLAQMGLTEDAISRITPLVQDFATAQKTSLGDAAKLVAKSLGSSTNALTRYGIEITGAVGSSDRLNSAVESLSKAFKGQAEAAAQVGLGPIVQLENAWGDLKEMIGELLMPIMVKFAKVAMDGVSSLQKAVAQIKPGIVEFINYFISLYNESAQFRASIEAVKLAFDIVWRSIKSFFKNVIGGFASIGKIIASAIAGNFDDIPGIIKGYWNSIVDDANTNGALTAKAFIEAQKNIYQKNPIPLIPTEDQKKQVIQAYSDLGSAAVAAMQPKTVQGKGAGALPGGTPKLGFEGFEMNTANTSQGVRTLQDDVLNLQAVMTDFATTGVVAFAEGLGNAMTGVGNFGEDLLAAVGGFLGQLGQQMIQLGIAKLALFKALETGPIGGPLIIAAGVALVAASKAISNSFSKASSSMGGGGGSGPSRTSTGVQTDLSRDKEPLEIMGEFEVRGDKLIAVLNKANYKRSITG